MKNKGFTLIEILGVITLLALISLIVIISVNKSLKEAKETLSQIQIDEIKSAAEMWKTDNIELIPNTDYYPLSLKILQNEGYIKENIIDNKTKQPIEDDLLISVGMNEIKLDDNYKTVYEHKGNYEFDGTNYIDTNVYLFNSENLYKNFEISIRIIGYDATIQQKHATMMSCMDETASPWPGILIRKQGDSLTNIEIATNDNTTPTTQKLFPYTDVETVKILRFNKKMYISINNKSYILAKDYTNFTTTLQIPVTFGASLDGTLQPFRHYIGTLSDLKIRLEN